MLASPIGESMKSYCLSCRHKKRIRLPDLLGSGVQLSVQIRNFSPASAYHPELRLYLFAIGGIREQHGWTKLRDTSSEWRFPVETEFRWDGGTDAIVYGRSIRRLPLISLDGAWQWKNAHPTMTLYLQADGVAPFIKKLDVKVITFEEYSEHREKYIRFAEMPFRRVQLFASSRTARLFVALRLQLPIALLMRVTRRRRLAAARKRSRRGT
jgi:hypothetical protein